MILNDEELNIRLSSKENLVNIKASPNVTVLPARKEQQGHVRVPEEVRKLLGVTAESGDATPEDLASMFGISAVAIRSYSRGLNGQIVDESLVEAITEAKTAKTESIKVSTESAHEMALDSLMESLTILKPKLSEPGLKVSTISKIARDMSGIVKNLTPTKEDKTTINNTQVILYNPGQNSESAYEEIVG